MVLILFYGVNHHARLIFRHAQPAKRADQFFVKKFFLAIIRFAYLHKDELLIISPKLRRAGLPVGRQARELEIKNQSTPKHWLLKFPLNRQWFFQLF